MACDLAAVLLALKLANGYIDQPQGATAVPVADNSRFVSPWGTATTMSRKDALAFHEREARAIRDEIAAEKKRESDLKLIDKTLKECGGKR